MKDKLKKIIKNKKQKMNYKKRYKNTLKELEEERNKNAELLKEIDNLEFLIDKDFQAQKIKHQETLLDDYRQKTHELRKELIELKENK